MAQAIETAIEHHRAGRLREAEAIYRRVLQEQPRNAEALHLLGVVAYQSGHVDDSIRLISQAIAVAPDRAQFHANLGLAFAAAGRYDRAVAAFERALSLEPNVARTHKDMGIALHRAGRRKEAIAAFGNCVQRDPNHCDAWTSLGEALREEGLFDQSLSACRRAVAINPQSALAQVNLGNILQNTGQYKQAAEAYRRAIELDPNMPFAFNNLGATYCMLHQVKEGIECYHRSLKLAPDSPDTLTNLANALREFDRVDPAFAAVKKALSINPDYYEAHHTLGSLYKDSGRITEAMHEYDRALELRPGFRMIDTNRAYLAHYDPARDGSSILQVVRQWNDRYAAPLQSKIHPHDNDRSPDRRLRIGYLSPNFSAHCFGRNMLPLYRQQNHQQFETFFYSDLTRPDEFTKRIGHCADAWRDVAGMTDAKIAEMIRQDRIDILVDHTMHMAYERLLVFAQKPAPVQVTFGAYPAGTGLQTMDYRLSDPWLDPQEFEKFYVERTERLPHSFWCYDNEGMSLADSPPVNPLPATTNGFVTFGCLNNFCKMNGSVLELWRKVLDAVGNSRLLLMAPEGSIRRRLSEFFQNRVDFTPRQSRNPYFAIYHRMDIGLDTFPYNGHTTSLDSLWMGVPIVTLIGQTAVGRAGLSQLTNLNMPELAAGSPEEFVAIAANLAGDIPKLRDIRATLRDRMRNSPLMDAAGFASGVEAAFRRMWHQWINR